MGQGRLVFVRTRTWQDARRNYSIEVDGHEVGVLKPKGSLEVDVSADLHTCQARISWTGSPVVEVEVQSGMTRRVSVVPAKGSPLTKLVGGTGWLALRCE